MRLRLRQFGTLAFLGAALGACTSVTTAASNEICTPSQKVRCNDCQSPDPTQVYRGWIQCSADGTSFVGTCTDCAPDNSSQPVTLPGTSSSGGTGFTGGSGGFSGGSSGSGGFSGGSSGGESGSSSGVDQGGSSGGVTSTDDGGAGEDASADDGGGSAYLNPSCADLVDGAYCGSDGVGGDPNTLYQCVGSTVTGSQPCTDGCSAGPSAGTDSCY